MTLLSVRKSIMKNTHIAITNFLAKAGAMEGRSALMERMRITILSVGKMMTICWSQRGQRDR